MEDDSKKNSFQDIVLNDIKKCEAILSTVKSTNGCLITKPVNDWVDQAKNRPIPNMLFSQLWYEGELGVLYADTNIGKSILAVQIADSISKGFSIEGFQNECKPKKVAYLDFELSDKQFENRCSNGYKNHYRFSPNFLRSEINTEVDLPKEFKSIEDYLCNSLNDFISKNKIEVLIVDNLTYLKSDNERAKDALELMKLLKNLSKKMGISILVLAHTPKRDESKPISKNDLAGSKMLMNFCDSAFAIGASSIDPSYRYLKQIKQRNTEHVYHSENVIVCKLHKPNNFLCFDFLEFGSERDHLRIVNHSELNERDEEMKNHIEQGLSNVAIGEKLGISEGAVRKRKIALGL